MDPNENLEKPLNFIVLGDNKEIIAKSNNLNLK